MESYKEQTGITVVDINKEMRDAYLQYSMSVIVGRALPDVRDGLKPVHRRILFAQYEMGNTHEKPYKKSARVVGDVIGKYHPHGDRAVYDTMVRMAQDFSLRYVLEDGQGNFGSIDGDSPAAMRYTEVRMTKLAEELLFDIDKDTIPFGPNYDDSLKVPLVLPAKFPNLLVNGSTGIAVGMATNIPPHNLKEVSEGCIFLIENPNATIDELIEIIKGPDFPSAGTIAGREGIFQAYKKGRGIIILKGKAEIETVKDREEIIITELPYQVNKAKLIENIADLVRDKEIEGVSDIRDESSREGLRVAITLKKGTDGNSVLNRLYKYTQMKVSVGIILIALDAKNQPVTFNLKQLLEAFIDHRRDIVTKRYIFDLKKAQDKSHLLEGLKNALDRIDDVISTIKQSSETKAAQMSLMERFDFSEKQAHAILEMRLQRLTGLEREKIEKELEFLFKQIENFKFVLSDVREIYKIIVNELREIVDKFGDDRRTEITGEMSDFQDEELIPDENVVVTCTNTGYIKRIPLDQYKLQKRGGKGLKGMETREEDYVSDIFIASARTTLLVFTDVGRVYWCKVYRLPVGSRTSKGKYISNIVNLQPHEKVVALLPVHSFVTNQNIVLLTKKGLIKKTVLKAYSHQRAAGVSAIVLEPNDMLVSAKLSDGTSDFFIATREGMSIRFNEHRVRPMGRVTRGMKTISLTNSDVVVGMEVLEMGCKDTLLMVTEKGYGKRSPLSQYRIQGRRGHGIITQKITDKVGYVVGTKKVNNNQELIVTTDKGQVIRMNVSDIRLTSKNAMGVMLINLTDKKELVTSFTPVKKEEVFANEEANFLKTISTNEDKEEVFREGTSETESMVIQNGSEEGESFKDVIEECELGDESEIFEESEVFNESDNTDEIDETNESEKENLVNSGDFNGESTDKKE